MMTLTRAGYVAHKWAAQGRTFIDANRVESVEELVDAAKGNTTVITLQSGCDHRVMETPEQIGALITLACNPLLAGVVDDALGTLAGIVGGGGVGGDPQGAPSKPEMP